MRAACLGPRFWRLWWAGTVDSVGDGAWVAALPLLTASLTADPRVLALVPAAAQLPWLLVSLPAGVLVDRRPRVPLVRRTQLAQALLVGALAVAVATGSATVPVLVVVAALLGVCEVVVGAAAASLLPDVVPRAELGRANGHQYASQVTGRSFVGPPLGSVLFAVAPVLPFVVDTVSFAGSAALLAGVDVDRPSAAPVPARTSRAVVEGLRWLAGHRMLRTLALLLGANNAFSQLGSVTLVLFATQQLHVGGAAYGVLLSAGALGSVLAGLVAPHLVRRVGRRAALVGALTCAALALLGAGLAGSAVVLAVLLALRGFAGTTWNVVTVTLRQELVPAHLLGRVTSAYRMLGWGLLPLGAVTGGLVAHALGLRAPLLLAGAARGVVLLAAVPVLLRTVPARPEPITPSAGPPGAG